MNFFLQGKICFHYRDPCNENRVPCNENRWEKLHRENPVFITGMGLQCCLMGGYSLKNCVNLIFDIFDNCQWSLNKFNQKSMQFLWSVKYWIQCEKFSSGSINPVKLVLSRLIHNSFCRMQHQGRSYWASMTSSSRFSSFCC